MMGAACGDRIWMASALTFYDATRQRWGGGPDSRSSFAARLLDPESKKACFVCAASRRSVHLASFGVLVHVLYIL